MSSRKGLSPYFFDIARAADKNKESIITSSLIIYALIYFAIGLGGVSFQSQPATGYLAEPNQPNNPEPENETFIDSAAQTVSISAKYTDDDGHDGTLTFYELAGNNIGSCSVNDGQRCGVDWSASHAENWWYAVADDDGDDATTRSNNWMFVLNQPPDQTTSPDSPTDGSTIYSDSTDLSAQVSDPDSDSLDATFYHNHSFSETTGPHSSGSTPSVTIDNLNRGDTYKWWMDVSDNWNTTKSSEWTFYINNLPKIYDPNPEDGGVVTTDNPDLNIKANDDNDDLTAYFFDDQNNYLGKEEFSSGGEAATAYDSEDTDIGEQYNWKVNVSDGFENITRAYSFRRTTTEDTRVDQRIDYRYSSVILSTSETRDIFFEVENKIDDSKDLKTYLSGVKSTFPEYNRNITDVYNLEGNSGRRFLVQITPESTGDRYLNITTENQKLGVNTTTRVPVTVKNYTDVSSSTSEVSGIGTVQLLMLLLVSAYLYSARL